MSYELLLPRLVATRQAVADLLTEDNLPADLTGETVVVVGRELSASTASFADELVKELAARNASRILLLNTPEVFTKDAESSAQSRNYRGLATTTSRLLSA